MEHLESFHKSIEFALEMKNGSATSKHFQFYVQVINLYLYAQRAHVKFPREHSRKQKIATNFRFAKERAFEFRGLIDRYFTFDSESKAG